MYRTLMAYINEVYMHCFQLRSPFLLYHINLFENFDHGIFDSNSRERRRVYSRRASGRYENDDENVNVDESKVPRTVDDVNEEPELGSPRELEAMKHLGAVMECERIAIGLTHSMESMGFSPRNDFDVYRFMLRPLDRV